MTCQQKMGNGEMAKNIRHKERKTSSGKTDGRYCPNKLIFRLKTLRFFTAGYLRAHTHILSRLLIPYSYGRDHAFLLGFLPYWTDQLPVGDGQYIQYILKW